MYMYTIDQPFSCRNSRRNINMQIYIWFLSKFISLHFSALWWRKWLKLPSWHTRTHLSCKVISVAVNVLVKSEVRASAAIVLILTLEPIRFSVRGGFNSWIGNIIDNNWRGSHIFVKIYILHWRGGVISAGFPLLAALRGVILTPFGAASDGNLVGVTTFQFQCFEITLKMLDYRVGQSREIYSNSVPLSPPHWPYPKRIRPPSWPRVAVALSTQNTKFFTWRTWPGAGAVPKCDWAARSQCGFKQRRAEHTNKVHLICCDAWPIRCHYGTDDCMNMITRMTMH